MTDATEKPNTYVVEYTDGPLEGQTDQRLLIGGEYDKTFGVIALVDGIEANFEYHAIGEREMNGETHVKYSFDASKSDSPVSDEEGVAPGEALV
ncbi:hypothetical protein [Subtercola boreus]|uniref:Uncharacterized protein n=1 Tax=Subtercola boreus TaxID=120213 RepID=A0A3E0WE72_9MICO|nr:hypothetical protein [Subtercola boreus]RFA22093.1 hypothetical protein B7R24_05255 [Subtercola boreus]RFA22273.1 hypothetical protein B7R23_05200 [Subtercola boreus]RFA28136.1 hypothetical protein B7R25_05325 [Subtercola boreus]